MTLDPKIRDLVLHFGEMGSAWGVSRSVGQVFGLLFVSNAPLNADQICNKLGHARSNVSMSLKELQSWNLVQRQHLQGDRREYFTTPDDPWEMVRNLAEQRKQREVDPTLTALKSISQPAPTTEAELYAQARVDEMIAIIELLTGWYEDVKQLETMRLAQLLSLGAKVQRVISMTDRLTLPLGLKTGSSGVDRQQDTGRSDP